MGKNLIAYTAVSIDAPIASVWKALVDPTAIKQYMFGTNIETDWHVGSAISWKGEWEGKSYEDKGVILQLRPGRTLQYSHFSPLSGLPDEPQNYHTVTIDVTSDGTATRVSLSQDNNPNDQSREHSEKNWTMMLTALKKFVEESALEPSKR